MALGHRYLGAPVGTNGEYVSNNVLNIANGIDVDAVSDMQANASALSGGIGLVDIGILKTTADVQGVTRAFAGQGAYLQHLIQG